MSIIDAAKYLQDHLSTSTRLPVALSRADLVTPGLLIEPPALSRRYDGACATATWHIYLLATDAGTPAALAQLSELLPAVLSALPGTGEDISTVAVDTGSGTCTGYQLTLSTRLTL